MILGQTVYVKAQSDDAPEYLRRLAGKAVMLSAIHTSVPGEVHVQDMENYGIWTVKLTDLKETS